MSGFLKRHMAGAVIEADLKLRKDAGASKQVKTHSKTFRSAQMMATQCPQCAYATAGLAGGPPLGGARRGVPLVGAGGSG